MKAQLDNRRHGGFSLVELVVVITIAGIIAAIVGTFIVRPIQGYDAQVRRAELVDMAESALRRMQRDIRRALPNSLRVVDSNGNIDNVTCNAGTVCAIEALNTVDGGRYRARPVGDRLQFNGADTSFDVIGSLLNTSAVNTSANWIVVNNQATSGNFYNAYNCGSAIRHNCVQMSNTSNLAATPQNIVTTQAFSPTTPLLESPRQRFYIVDTPISFICDPSTGQLNRHDSYAINPAQTVTPGGTVGRLATSVTSCTFSYQPGTSTRAGMITLSLTVRDANTGEQVRLMHQVHVYNVP